MPLTPYSVSILVYDTNGTTPLESANVTLINLNTTDRESRATESDGSVIFDLSNFPNGYTIGDTLLIYMDKVISPLAEKFTSTTTTVTGTGLDLTLTAKLYIDKSVYPLTLDKRDIERRVYEPSAMASRVTLVDEDGLNYLLIGKRKDYGWDLILPDGTKFGEFRERTSGEVDLNINGEVSVLQSF